MKIDRYNWRSGFTVVKRVIGVVRATALILIPLIAAAGLAAADRFEDQPDRESSESHPRTAKQNQTLRADDSQTSDSSHGQALWLIEQVMAQITLGAAYDAKIRQTVWTAGQEVVGVGTYEQAGNGTGQFNLQVTMHDGTNKHRLQQISDGRLTWTRSEIAGGVSLRRVDVGRLDQWVGHVDDGLEISPGLRVGGWTEMLDSLRTGYTLRLDNAHLERESVVVVSASLNESERKRILRDSGRQTWPPLYPTFIRVAIRTDDTPQRYGKRLPIRLEYWSDPTTTAELAADTKALADHETTGQHGRLISLIEQYSIRPVAPPPIQRFRLDNQDADVNFLNETDRYIQRYGVRLTRRQRQQLHR